MRGKTYVRPGRHKSFKNFLKPKNARRKKNSNYRAGSESVPALEESLYTEDDLGQIGLRREI